MFNVFFQNIFYNTDYLKYIQIAVKRKEVKIKGEKKRYTHLNAEFQRIARSKESLPQRLIEGNRGKQ